MKKPQRAGLDIEMPATRFYGKETGVKAVENGSVRNQILMKVLSVLPELF
jgi:hypothetical protein